VVAGALQVLAVECVAVDDQHPAGSDVVDIGPQGGRVQRHQHVGEVGGGAHGAVGEVHLEAGYARQRPGRSANLRGEVGERGEVVPGYGGRVAEPAAGQLDSITGIPGESDRNPPDLLGWLGLNRHSFDSARAVPENPADCSEWIVSRRGAG